METFVNRRDSHSGRLREGREESLLNKSEINFCLFETSQEDRMKYIFFLPFICYIEVLFGVFFIPQRKIIKSLHGNLILQLSKKILS